MRSGFSIARNTYLFKTQALTPIDHGSRLPEIHIFLKTQALTLMETRFTQIDKKKPFESMHYRITLCLGVATHEKFPCENYRHEMDCVEIQPVLEKIAMHFLQTKLSNIAEEKD